jgi:uncharacterized MAPEG superfamily protein
MSIALATVLIAGILPVLTVGIAKASAPKASGGYNNRSPRDWAETLNGYQRRAYAAHQNHFEFFPLFAIAVLVARAEGPSRLVDGIAVLCILARLVYTAAYLGDKPRLRSLAWTVGWFGAVTIFITGLV